MLDLALVLGAGLALGIFLGRLLSEVPQVTWPFYRWYLTAALAVAVSAASYALWRVSGSTRAAAVPYLAFYALLVYVFQPTPNLLCAGVLLAGALILFLLFRFPWLRLRSDRGIAFLLFALALAAYLITLTPAVGTRDGYELQAISATLGFAHPTGYPLFPIVGRLWLLLFPFGSVAWRINVLCALFAALSVSLVYGIARRVFDRQPVAILAALLLGFSNTLWAQAVRPEKYTLNAFFVALTLYIAFGTCSPEERGPHPHLRMLGWVYGLSLCHHRTMLMLAPALGLYLLWRDPGLVRRPKEWLSALGLALTPLLIYLYIPWRAAVQGWTMTPSEFIEYISGAYYGPAVRLMDWTNPDRVHMFWRFLRAQFGAVGIGLGITGLVGLGLLRRWRFLVCTALIYATYYFWGTVWYAYYNDVNSFIPNHMIFALWIGGGALAIWRLCGLSRFGKGGYAAPLYGSALALLLMWMIWTNGPQVDASDEWNLTQWGAYAVSQEIAPGATILADREKYPPLDYFARIERRRPDVDVALLGDERTYLDRLAWDLAQGRTVYLARFLPGLEGPYHLRSLGPLVEVGTVPLDWADGQDLPMAGFGAGVQLLECEIEEEHPLAAGGDLHVTLYWRTSLPVPGNYQVNLRLVSEGGQVWWTASDHPVSGMYPTAAWKPGEVIPDWHEIPIPGTIPPGLYVLEVGLFPPFSADGLSYGAGKEWLPLHEIEVVLGDEPSIPHRLRAIQPGQWQLLGYDLPRQAPPTGRVPLTLYWRALAPLPDLEIGTRLVTSAGAGEWSWVLPGRGEYPSSHWLPGRTVEIQRGLTMPAEQGQVTVQLAVRALSGQADHDIDLDVETESETFFPRWLARRVTALSFPPLTVSGRPPAAEGTFNFDDRILLLDADLSGRTLQPGAPLELEVRWECVRAMDADYTLFVQLLGPDGTLQGQIDVWPGDGTHPTSAWREGEVIEDRYVVFVAQDAPEGEYRVAIGWYLLETMQRLPVLDAEGQALDDKVLLSGLVVER